ncbi:MAG: TraX family protein [Pseudomonadota bacterium]|nr:TraX family protein [Pseudomonadota bacterium]
MKKLEIQSDFLKIWALVAMTADYADKNLWQTEWISDTIGRMAFPIFAFLIISNYQAFHPFQKYVIRLGFFGILTELILSLFRPMEINILFTFLWAILYLRFTEFVCKKTKSILWQAYWTSFLFFIMLPVILMSDYSLFGFLFLMALYAYKIKPSRLNYWAVLITGGAMNFYSVIAVCSTIITLIILMSGIKIAKGIRMIKWWGFYFYYPLHLLFLNTLRNL